MKSNLDKLIAGTVVTVLPLFIAVGCAGDAHNLSHAEELQEHVADVELLDEQEAKILDSSTTEAIVNMEAYMAHISEAAVEGGVVEITKAVESEADISLAESNLDESEQLSLGSMTDEELLVAEILGEGALESKYEASKLVLPPPQQLVFHFGVNKNELKTGDVEIIRQHAAYLLENSNYILVINGHADNRGAKLYNQRLSELRAKNIADVLIAEGVPESQLRIGGMGDTVPMVSPDNWNENRRVEFVYQDSMVAKSQ